MRLKIELKNLNSILRSRPQAGVYRFLNAELEILYIGCTYDFSKRLPEHKPWIIRLHNTEKLAFIDLYPCDSDSMYWIEKQNINHYSPKYNHRHNRKSEKVTFYAYNTLPLKLKNMAAQYDISISSFCNQIMEFGLNHHMEILKKN